MNRELPASWAWATFSDVAQVESDLVEPVKLGHLPHVAPNHIESGTGVLLDYLTVAEDGVTSPKHRFKAGHILYSKIRPYLAKAVLVDFEGLCSADMYPVQSRIDPSYLHRWLVGPEFTSLASQHQGRTVLPKINQAALACLPVPVPPIQEQRRIAAKLEDLFARTRSAREALEAIPPLLERYRQSVLAAAFRGDLTSEWREYHPAEVLNLEPSGTCRKPRGLPREVLMNKVAAGWTVPPCWSVVSIAELLHHGAIQDLKDGNHGELHPRVADFTPEGVPFLTASNVSGDRVDYEDAPKVSDAILKRLRVGFARPADVLLTHKGSVGRVAVCDRDCVLSPQVTYYRTDQRTVLPEYLRWCLSSPFFQRQLRAVSSQTTRDYVPISKQYHLFVAIAPPEEQIAINRVLERLFEQLSTLQARVQSLTLLQEQMPSSILSRAFRGELVPQDPEDEPASILLRRIQAERKTKLPTRSGRGRPPVTDV